MKEFFINILDGLGLSWWAEIVTDAPRCTYYFGPFASEADAQAAKAGYIEDLEQEGAVGIRCTVKRCKPDRLTIYDDAMETIPTPSTAVLSGQT